MHTNSLSNLIIGNARQPVPRVGMGATILLWTDRNAATITAVRDNGRTVYVQRDRAIRTDNNGMSECQEYRYVANPDSLPQVFTRRKSGEYVEKGRTLGDGYRLAIGQRNEYHDFSF